MTFKPGAPGRPLGSKNKVSAKFAEVMKYNGIDVAQEMLDLYLQAKIDGDLLLAARMLCEMAQYVYPKKKDGEPNQYAHLTPQDKLEYLKDAQKMLEMQIEKETK